MRRAILAIVILPLALLISGCIAVATPAVGTLYTDVKGPIDADGAIGTKQGKACATSILSMFATGDASIQAAATKGGIRNVSSVDHHSRNILGIYGEFCTIVRGS